MKYLATEVEITKTGTGKDMYKVTLKDEQGNDEKLNMFDKISEGMTLEGDIYLNDKGYKNFRSSKQVAGANFKNMQMEKMVEKKQEGIFKAQDNKDYSIKVSSTINKAVELAIAEYANPKSLFTLEELIVKWRRFLWLEWDNLDDMPPFK